MARQVLSERDRIRLEEEQLRIAANTGMPVITEEQRLALEAQALKDAGDGLGAAETFGTRLRRLAPTPSESTEAPRKPSIPSFDDSAPHAVAEQASTGVKGRSTARKRDGRESLRHASIEPRRIESFGKWFVMGGMALSMLYGFLRGRGQADAADEAQKAFSRPEDSAAALVLGSVGTFTSAREESKLSLPNTAECRESVGQVAGRADFSQTFGFIVSLEGGWSNDPNDAGGETYKGITKGAMKDCRTSSDKGLQRIGRKSLSPGSDNRITDAEILEIYEKKYWKKIGCDAMPECLGLVFADAAVNHGPEKAKQLFWKLMGQHGLQKADLANISSKTDLALAEEYMDMRRAYYETLANYDYFGEGWRNRMDKVGEKCRAMYDARGRKKPTKE